MRLDLQPAPDRLGSERTDPGLLKFAPIWQIIQGEAFQ
jgi:hypothetical protein